MILTVKILLLYLKKLENSCLRKGTMVKIKKRNFFFAKNNGLKNGNRGKIESKKKVKCFECLRYGH